MLYTKAWAVAKGLEIVERDKLYSEFLDNEFPVCKVAGLSYFTSLAFRRTDPTMFKFGAQGYLEKSIASGLVVELSDKTLVWRAAFIEASGVANQDLPRVKFGTDCGCAVECES